MRNWRVSRFADDPPIPNDDASPDSVTDLPCEDETDMLAFFSFYRDRARGARRRNYHLDQTGRVVCDLDREATMKELARVVDMHERAKAGGAPEGPTSVGDVDEDGFPLPHHGHGCPSCNREYLCANEPCEPGWSDLCPDCTARGVHP